VRSLDFSAFPFLRVPIELAIRRVERLTVERWAVVVIQVTANALPASHDAQHRGSADRDWPREAPASWRGGPGGSRPYPGGSYGPCRRPVSVGRSVPEPLGYPPDVRGGRLSAPLIPLSFQDCPKYLRTSASRGSRKSCPPASKTERRTRSVPEGCGSSVRRADARPYRRSSNATCMSAEVQAITCESGALTAGRFLDPGRRRRSARASRPKTRSSSVTGKALQGPVVQAQKRPANAMRIIVWRVSSRVCPLSPGAFEFSNSSGVHGVRSGERSHARSITA